MDTTRLEQGARLEVIMKALGHNQPSFSAEIGVNQSNLSAAINGKRPVTRLIEKITKQYPFVNPAWIMWEQGEMFLEKKAAEPGLLTGVMEPDARYDVVKRIALEDLAGIIERLQVEVGELRERVRRLEEGAGKDESKE